jgi:hypothetical protein
MAQLAAMRVLILALACSWLAACGSICWDDPHGLDAPPHGSSIPAPHG